MKLVVTGGAGFIGSHFIRRWLERHPLDVITNLDALTYAGSRERVADVEDNPQYEFLHGDIGSREVVERAMRGCDVVVHFAAETHVDRSITDAAPFLRTNVEGTYRLLQAAQEHGVERFIYISTDEVYGPILEGRVDEHAPFSPRSPYAASKAAADLLTQAYYKTHSLPTTIIRPTNIFGPGQFPEKFIPLCITNATDGLPVPIYGDGQQQRSWLYVTDLCDAIQVILQHGGEGESYNVAGGTDYANLDTARKLLAHLGLPASLTEFVEDRPGHDRRYAMNDAKLRALGWQPQVSFDQGLKEVIAWYRTHTAWWRPLTQKLREDSYHWLNRSPRPSAQQPSGQIL